MISTKARHLLDEMERLELRVAALYDRMAEQYASIQPGAAGLFMLLASEERSHARSVAHVGRILRQNPLLSGLQAFDQEAGVQANALLTNAESEMETLSVQDALAVAWLLEKRIGEGYLLVRLAEANPVLGRLLAALSDPGHMERVREYARRWGFLPCLPEKCDEWARRVALNVAAAS